MKSLFSRLRHNKEVKENSSSQRPSSSRSDSNNDALRPGSHRASSYTADRPHTPIAAFHSQSSSGSSDSLRPHSIAGDVIYEDETIRARTLSGENAGVKKVTFRSPAPTPATSLVLEEMPMYDTEGEAVRNSSQAGPGTSMRPPVSHQLPRPPSASSRSASRQSFPNAPKSIITRKPSLPGSSQPSTSPTKSMLSPTPSEQSLAGMSTRSYLPPPNSWSEMAEDDLIANLGPRERTRQEVLWEIVSSEERYVQELIKLNETFALTLLPPSARSHSLELFDPANILSRTLSPALSAQSPLSTAESFEHLPIAAQYSHLPAPAATGHPRMEAYQSLTNGRPGELSRSDNAGVVNGAGPRSHRSLPPPRRDAVSGSSNASRMSYHPSGKAKGHDTRAASGNSVSSVKSAEATLPEALEKVMTVLAGGILEGHIKLAAALRKRYENQYPLVRSLADVFTAHSYILREYATYVLHLEEALEQVEHALATFTSQPNKRASRRLDETDLGRLGKILYSLEELAADRGESGLQISLSKPFQRLLKYPLLFQNLLFNTDPSLKEYEATLAMVDDVEEIVRTIEDEKATNEERVKTRDVWARIEGLDREKTLMAPKPNRLLVSEVQMDMSETDVKALKETSTRQKKSFRRLSDILKGGETADLWVVRFSDVSLLCERTGMTNLPLSNYKAGKRDSMSETSGRSRHSTTGRRTHSIKARNLYRFVRIHEWHLRPKTGSTEALLSMEDISRARSVPPPIHEKQPVQESKTTPSPGPSSNAGSPQKPLTIPLKGDGGASPAKSITRRKGDSDTETMASDRLSVMSFAFKGAEQVKPAPRRTRPVDQMPVAGTAAAGPPARTFAKSSGPAVYPQRRSTGPHMSGNAANAKFAHRLRPHDAEHENNGETTVRPISRTRQSLPPSMAQATKPGRASPVLSPTDRNAARPPWNSSTAPASKLKSNPPSIAPSTRESVRGVRGIDTSVTGTGRRVVPKAVAAVKAADGIESRPQPGAAAGMGTKGVRPSTSTDSGVAGMWNTYREGGATGTPRKVPPRQLGGRI